MISVKQIDIDIMTHHGDAFYGRYKGPCCCQLKLSPSGKAVESLNSEYLMEAILSRYPTLKGRKDLVLFDNLEKSQIDIESRKPDPIPQKDEENVL